MSWALGPLLLALVLTIALPWLGGRAADQPAYAAAVIAAETAEVPTPLVTPSPRERTTRDRLITVAAIGSIVLVAVAGTYIYVLIRKGL